MPGPTGSPAAGGDEIAGRDGDDDLRGDGGDDLLAGGRGRDRLGGGDGADYLEGGEGDDRLLGGDDADTLFGDGGADLPDGGRGADFLRPGGGDGGGDRLVLGSDAADLAVLAYFGPDPSADQVGAVAVEGFAAGPAHVLRLELAGLLPDGRRLASVDTRDLLDSDDDGRVTAADREVSRSGEGGRDLVLDLDAVLARAFGPGDHGRQEVGLEGDGDGVAASRIDPGVTAGPIVTEDGVVDAS